MSDRVSVVVMTSISDNVNYYNKYRHHYWDSICKAVRRCTETVDVTVCFRVFGTVFDADRIMADTTYLRMFENVKIDVKVLRGTGPARGTLLKEAFQFDPDFYTFMDFDDAIGKSYFDSFVPVSQRGYEQIIAMPVREYNKLIIPKNYLHWVPKLDDTLHTFLVSERYGHMIWGRFFSRELVNRVLPLIDPSYDRIGWGEEYKLLNLLLYSTSDISAIGICNSLYKWNYGDETSLSKNIHKSTAIDNITESLKVVPDAYREDVAQMYHTLLQRCIDKPSDLSQYNSSEQLEFDFNSSED